MIDLFILLNVIHTIAHWHKTARVQLAATGLVMQICSSKFLLPKLWAPLSFIGKVYYFWSHEALFRIIVFNLDWFLCF